MRLCLVTPQVNKGWILDRFAIEIAKRYDNSEIVYHCENLPSADQYVLMHYSMLPIVFGMNSGIKNVNAFFTHESVKIKKFSVMMNRCNNIFVASERSLKQLVDGGVKENLIRIVPEGSDPSLFKPHRRSERGILISSAFYPRKQPDKLLEIIKGLPEKEFGLVGRQWNVWPKFDQMLECDNFKYYDGVSYDLYPEIYDQYDTFLSCASVEGGGPNGLIEAMMANLFPVVTDTGNAQEYIFQGYNGVFLPVDTPASKFIEILKKVDTNEVEVSKTVQGFTWETFAKEILNSLFPSLILLTKSEADL